MPGYSRNPGGSAETVSFTPSGNISATTLQAAVTELDTEKAALVSPTFTGTITGSTFKNPSSTVANLTLNSDGSVSGGIPSGGRNRIINGDFSVWQRGTSPTVTSGAYLADRWRSVFDGSGSTRSCSAQTFTLGSAPVAGYEGTTFMRYAQSVAGTGGTYTWLSQLIESVRTFAGQRITVSFWAKADANLTLPSVVLRQFFGSGGSPSSPVDTTVTTNTAVTTAWKRFAFSVDVPSIAGKQLGTTDNSYLEVAFSLPLNTTYTFDVWGVQVEAGSAPTPFEVEPFGDTLRKCQRYYEKSYSTSVTPGTNTAYGLVTGSFNAAANTTGFMGTYVQYKVTKRALPSLTFYDEAGTSGKCSRGSLGYANSNAQTVAYAQDTETGFLVYSSGTSNNQAIAVHFVASAEF